MLVERARPSELRRRQDKQTKTGTPDRDSTKLRAMTLLQSTVFSFSMRVWGQREEAEDTMQEVLLKSVPYLPKFDSPKALVAWL